MTPHILSTKDTKRGVFELHDLVGLVVVLVWFCERAPLRGALQMCPLHPRSLQTNGTAWFTCKLEVTRLNWRNINCLPRV